MFPDLFGTNLRGSKATRAEVHAQQEPQLCIPKTQKKNITIFLSHLRPALKRERAKRKAEGTPDADSNGRPKPKAKGKAKNTPAAKAKK